MATRKEIKEIVSEALAISGVTVDVDTTRPHPKLTIKFQGQSRLVFIANSAGDKLRNAKNSRGYIRRALKEMGAINA